MRMKLFAVAGLVGVALAMTPAAVAGASTSNSLPPACVHQTIPLPGGGQLNFEFGYCPNG